MTVFELLRLIIRRAAIEVEETRTRLTYLEKPDSETEADDWRNAETWNSRRPIRRRNPASEEWGAF